MEDIYEQAFQIAFNNRSPKREQEEQLKEEDWNEAFRLFRSSSTSHTKSYHEQCDPACPFFIYKDLLYICYTSGNYHICTSDQCDQLMETREALVCNITAQTYPSPVKADEFDTREWKAICKKEYDSHAPNLEQMKHTHQLQEKINKVLAEQKLELLESVIEQPSEEETSEEPAAKRRKKKKQALLTTEIKEFVANHKRQTVLNHHQLQVEAYNLITSFLLPGISPSEAYELSTRVVKLYTRVYGSEPWKQFKKNYSFHNHVICSLYEMTDGFTEGGIPLVPYIRENLPTKRELQKKNRKFINCNTLTKSSKVLRAALVTR